MKPLTITAHVDGHIIRGRGLMTLDALLASVIFDQTGSITRAHTEVPIQCQDCLYWASRAYFEETQPQPFAMVQSFRPDDVWLNPKWIEHNKKGSLHRKFSSMPSPILNTYSALTTPTISWYCTGDQTAIQDLLKNITHIGKKRVALVSRWDVEEGDLDGLHGFADEPLRPVPIDRWDGSQDGVIVDTAWAPAYWDVSNRTACFV